MMMQRSYITSILQKKKLRIRVVRCLVQSPVTSRHQSPATYLVLFEAKVCTLYHLALLPQQATQSRGHRGKLEQIPMAEFWAEWGRDSWARVRRPGPSEGRRGDQDWVAVSHGANPPGTLMGHSFLECRTSAVRCLCHFPVLHILQSELNPSHSQLLPLEKWR